MLFNLPESIIERILYTCVTVVIAVLLNVIFRSFIRLPSLNNARRGKTYTTIIRNFVTLIIVIIALHVIFLIFAINITPLLASAGVIGVVVGIGARSVFEDLIAGFFLTTQSTVAVGDYINLSNGVEGSVMNIGLKNMTLKGNNGSLITVPNGQIKNIINLTYGKAVNMVTIPVKSGQAIDTIIAVITEALEKLKKDETFELAPDSEVIGITNIDGQQGITIMTKIITPYGLRGKVDNEFRYRVIKAFEKHKLLLA